MAAPAAAQPADLMAEAQAKGAVRVILKIAAPWFLGEARLRGDGQAVARQRADISNVQAAAVAVLAGTTHRVLWRYETSPFIAVEVTPDALVALASSPVVESLTRDFTLSPKLADSGPIVQAPQLHAAGITGTGQGVIIVDTGIERAHPFFSGRVVAEFCLVSTPDGCPNGSTGPGAANPVGDHGTHVAGIAAGSGVSFSGMAPGADIIAMRVASSAGISFADVKAAFDRAVTLKDTRTIAAVNVSLGTDALFSTVCDDEDGPFGLKPDVDALRASGIATVVATGNDGNTGSISYPACLSSVIRVSATTKTDVIASYSNLAPALESSTLLAPGGGDGAGSICSSVPFSSFSTCSNAGTEGPFAAFAGTSMATPHVTGAWALLKEVNPNATVDDILAALHKTGQPITDKTTGVTYRRIRIANAAGLPPPPPPPPPGNAGVTVTLNRSEFHVGDTLVVDVKAANPIGNSDAELYVGFLLPDGSSLAFMTAPGVIGGQAAVASPARYIRLAPAPPGFSLDAPSFLKGTFPPSGIPFGPYRAFIALVRRGAFTDNKVDPGDVVAFDAKDFTFLP
jgi:subtilisin